MNSFHLKTISVLHIFSAVITIVALFSIYYFFDNQAHAGGPTAVTITLLAAISWFALVFLKKSIHQKIESIIQSSQCANFSAQNTLSFTDVRQGKYIGIDKNNGTMLVISLGEKIGNIASGIDFKDLLGYELSDCNLTLKFNNPNTPTFNINSNAKIKDICHKLDVFLSKSFKPEHDTGKTFSQFVQAKPYA